MDQLLSARALMGISLAFHIIYATIGIGLPMMLMIAEGMSLRTGNEVYHQIARRWIRQSLVLFAIGAVSGTILSFELGLLWPAFMGFAGGLVGLAFSMEGFAFFTEAIFLALYAYGESRLSRRALFLTTIPITVAAAASAGFVISANGWMNTPAGFELVNGELVNVRPLQAFFNPAWLHEALHGTLAAYVATGFAVAGVYAVAMLRGDHGEYNRKALTIAMAVGSIALPLMLVTGDYNARSIAGQQPWKLAAAEGLFVTQAGAPLHILGWPDPNTQQIYGGIELPKFLSLLAYHDPNATVTGLDAFPRDNWPDPRLVHFVFDAMVGSFFIMLLAMVVFWYLYFRRRNQRLGRWPLLIMLIAAPFGMIALETGWMTTEFGRQPWIAQLYMRVAQAVTPREGIGLILLVFLLVYLALTAGLLLLLVRRSPPRTGKPQAVEARHA